MIVQSVESQYNIRISEIFQLKVMLHYSLAINSTDPEEKCGGLEDSQNEHAIILLTSYQAHRARVKVKIVKWDKPKSM